MMNEKQLIDKIRELRQIKPRKDWVLFTKKEIFKDEPKRKWFSFFEPEVVFVFHHKPVFALLVVFLVLVGAFGFTQNSMPGDSLFPLKKIAEKSQSVFVSQEEQVKVNLGLVGKRLDDLEKIAETNSVKNLAPAITEYQESISLAAEGLEKVQIKEIISEVKKMEQKTEKIKSYGIEIEENQEFKNALDRIVKKEIDDLENMKFEGERTEALGEIKENYEAGEYYQALEKILILSNNLSDNNKQ